MHVPDGARRRAVRHAGHASTGFRWRGSSSPTSSRSRPSTATSRRRSRWRRRCSSSFTARSEEDVAAQARETGEIAAEHGGSDFAWAADEARAPAALARAPPRLRCGARAAAGHRRHDHRRVRADLGARRLHRGGAGRHRRARRHRADRRPRRRRQLPHAACSSTRTTPTTSRAPRSSTTGWSSARSRTTARAPASTASATASRGS